MEEGRWFAVIVRDADGKQCILSRRMPGPCGPFDGPWGALTQDEAEELAGLWNADQRDDGTAEVAEMYRYDNMPVDPFLTRQGWRPNPHKKPKRIIKSIVPEGEAEVTCLSVEAEDSLYVTEHCIVTHNTWNFYRTILDPTDPDPVVVDRHVHDAIAGVPYGNAERGLSNKTRYATLAHAVRLASRELGTIPAVVQPVLWVVHTDLTRGTGTRPKDQGYA